MKIGRLKVKKQWVVLLLGLVLLALIATGQLPLLSIVTNYQGPQPLFYSVRYNGKTYDDMRPAPGGSRFDTMLYFDPDSQYSGMGNLVGEETGMFIPSVSRDLPPSWVPRSWYSGWYMMQNPVKTYEWKLPGPDGSITYYKMEEWVMEWFVSIKYTWDSDDEAYHGWWPNAEATRYHNVEVWFKIGLQPIWYFKGANETYFGIAKIVLKNIRIEGMNPSAISVAPDSPGSVLPMYLEPYSGQVQPRDAYYYKGRELNPEVFAHAVYTYIRLDNFGAQIEKNWLGQVTKIQGDVVTMEFEVHVFVVGEWKVRNTQEVPENYGAHAMIVEPWYWYNGLGNWLNNPLSWLALGGIGLIALVVILAIFFPEALLVLTAFIRGVRKK